MRRKRQAHGAQYSGLPAWLSGSSSLSKSCISPSSSVSSSPQVIMSNLLTILYSDKFLASITTQASPIPTTPNPSSHNKIPKPNQPTVNVLPQFLSVHQLVDVLEGSTAELECKLGNLGKQHTVSIFLMTRYRLYYSLVSRCPG